MRDSMMIHDSNAIEVAPLIPDPPQKRKRRFRQGFLHRCWNLFTSCSRWTCIFITLVVIVLIIIVCRTLLPFGWPSWVPKLSYDTSAPHIIIIMADDLGWNDVGYSQLLLNNIDSDDSEVDSDVDSDNNSDDDSSSKYTYNFNSPYFTEFSQLLELEKQLKLEMEANSINSESKKNKKKSKKSKKKKNSDKTEESDADADADTAEADTADAEATVASDDLSDDLFSDGEAFRTPNIDGLAEQGIVLDRFYVSQEGSSTRASVLAGKHGYRMGLQSGIKTGSNAHLPLSAATLAEVLKDKKGYATHLVGKWNLGYARWVYTPLKRGFDTFLGFHQQWLDYWHYTTSDEYEYENRVGYDLWNGMKKHDIKMSNKEYATELFTNKVKTIIEDHATSDDPDQPMFLMYTAPNPHTPLQYHSKFSTVCSGLEETLRQKYCNLVQSLDMSIGAVVSALVDNNMWERSIVLIMSDNGGMICYDVGDTDTCSAASNYPLRAGKGTLFEGGIRTRALITGGQVPESRQGGVYTHPMQHIDVFPTLLVSAGLSTDEIEKYDVDGKNHYDYFFNEDDDFVPRQEVILEAFKDDDGNLIRAAFIEYPYKYIIQMDEPYDGWYTSPFDGGDEIPEEAQANKGTYTTPYAGIVSLVDNFEEYYEHIVKEDESSSSSSQAGSSSSSSNSIESASESEGINFETGKSNKLYFGNRMSKNSDEEDDEVSDEGNEADELSQVSYNEYLFNLYEDAYEQKNLASTMDDTVSRLRDKLIQIIQSEDYRSPQDSTSKYASSPAIFNNIWYPYEERGKGSKKKHNN